jgi:hypothetical protein
MRDVCVLLLREPVRCYDVFLFLFVFFKYFFKRPEITVLGSEVPGIKGLFDTAVDCPKWTKNKGSK